VATYQDFFTDVLNGLGVPVTPGALAGIADVVNEEGSNSYYNPFNIEWHPGSNTAWKGVSNFNSVGVQEYGSYQQGVQATVAFLQDNSGWQPFITALKTGDKNQIDQAFTNVYSWAPFRATTVSNDQAILARSVGSGTPGVTLVSGAPYDPAKLKAPLTAAQRTAIETWIELQITTGKVSDPNVTMASMKAATDAELIQLYSTVYSIRQAQGAPITGPGSALSGSLPSWTSELGSALGWLTTAKNWQRIGLFALGAIILLVVAIEFFKPESVVPV